MMSIKIKAVKSDADKLNAESVLREPTSAQKHNLHTMNSPKNLSRTLALQASSELHTMKLQMKSPSRFQRNNAKR